MTDTNKFRTLCKEQIVRIEREVYGREVNHEDIQMVFLSYVLGQMKATLVVGKQTEGRYYECSYSHINDKMFIDVYKQVDSVVVQVGE
jgi:hypothetical protein